MSRNPDQDWLNTFPRTVKADDYWRPVIVEARQIWLSRRGITARRRGFHANESVLISASLDEIEAVVQDLVRAVRAAEARRLKRLRAFRHYTPPTTITIDPIPLFGAIEQTAVGDILLPHGPLKYLDFLATAFGHQDELVAWLRRRPQTEDDEVAWDNYFSYFGKRPRKRLIDEDVSRLYEDSAKSYTDSIKASEQSVFSIIWDSGNRPMTSSCGLGYFTLGDDTLYVTFDTDLEETEWYGETIIAALRPKDARKLLQYFLREIFASNGERYGLPFDEPSPVTKYDETLLTDDVLGEWNLDLPGERPLFTPGSTACSRTSGS